MRYFLTALLSALISISVEADVEFATTSVIPSSHLKETRTYHVYLPPSYHHSEQDYPVIYLLDGDIHRLKAFAGMLEGLSTETLER